MNISSILQEGQRTPERPEEARPSLPAGPQARVSHEYRHDMASTRGAGPYVNASPAYTRPPQPPPSPPAEDLNTHRKLPSIQSLIARDDSPAKDQDRRDAHSSTTSPSEEPGSRRPPGLIQPIVSNPGARPHSPPIDPLLRVDTNKQSPSTTSPHSSQPTSATSASADTRSSRQPHVPPSPAMTDGKSQIHASYSAAQYPEATSASSNTSYPESAGAAPHSLYNQQPLPAAFSPANAPGTTNPQAQTATDTSPTENSTPSQWQHHHFIAPSASAVFPGQPQDRYVCQVCNKAFSRPSSLRIHSHSHTGEKPFQCPHKGCGKAFSVRSNMKRHERGCHGGGSSSGNG